ncbi:MAG: cellulase (glycosyl hydrolase family 5), partial [Oscillospiraceae bacterium]
MCYNDVQNGALCTKNDITRKDIKIMKTLLALLCTLTMLLTGCSNSDSTGANSPTSEADSSAVEQVKSARVTIEGTKFMVDGKELWINGVNTPWQAWNDFCGNMDEAAWEQTFALLKQDNINCTRIWINCNGTGVVRVDENGKVYNINENHWTDLDKLFALAEKYEIYVMPTLTSFDHFKQGNTGANNWRTLISTKEGCDDFAEKYAGEFARRYAQCEYIFGVDIMNEPDWVYENAECGNISWKNLQYFFGKCAEAIHANSDIPVTVGLAMIKYNSDRYDGNFVSNERLKEAVGSDEACLDFYSPHFYMWEKPSWG